MDDSPLTPEERRFARDRYRDYILPARMGRRGVMQPQTSPIWSKITPFELLVEALKKSNVANLEGKLAKMRRIRSRDSWRDPDRPTHDGVPSDLLGYANDLLTWEDMIPGTPLNMPVEEYRRWLRKIYEELKQRHRAHRDPILSQARDLANGEMAGILRESGQTQGLAEEGSALDRAMASGILPSQVGKFLTSDPNIERGSEGSVKRSLRNLRASLGGRRRKTRKTRRRR